MHSIEIRAIQPDNESAIGSLMSLFPRAYGNRFPNASVYDMRFWKSHIGTKMVSVGLFLGKEMIAHAALLRDRIDRGLGHIVYPACEPEMLPAILGYEGAIERMLISHAERQGWRSLSFAVFGDIVELQEIAGSVLGMKDTLLLPNYHPLVDLRPSSLRRYRAGLRSGFSDLLAPLIVARREITRGGRSAPMHAPHKHIDLIGEIFDAVGIAPVFVSRVRGVAALPADGRSIERYFLARRGVSHSFVQPSLLSGQDLSSLDSRGSRQHSSYVYIDLGDPACPYVADALEERGFSFAGALPSYKARDYVVYFKSNEPLVLREMFVNAGGKRIASYIESSRAEAAPSRQSNGIHQAFPRQ